MTIAEILKEGERLEREARAAWNGASIRDARAATKALVDFRNEHWATLLAVAKAAVEVVDADDDTTFLRLMKARIALRAAVRGEGKETTNG